MHVNRRNLGSRDRRAHLKPQKNIEKTEPAQSEDRSEVRSGLVLIVVACLACLPCLVLIVVACLACFPCLCSLLCLSLLTHVHSATSSSFTSFEQCMCAWRVSIVLSFTTVVSNPCPFVCSKSVLACTSIVLEAHLLSRVGCSAVRSCLASILLAPAPAPSEH